ncbi:mandelate racemase/muconate lactonizing enzyme, C-terminal domain protein [delta proteobacterium NaphS2]|nr:mandelate racemase/muconate lactonizing enzyme, C-terminal domain protein [delta proteobacterium NaphS2]
MQIKSVNIYQLAMPFKGEFAISIRKGVQSRIVVVGLVGEDHSLRGYGEGIPIKSVTGETPESVANDILQFLDKPSFPWELEDVSQIWDFVDGFSGEKDHNAAICAMETALLDMLGKVQRQPLVQFFQHPYLTDTIHYGVPVPLGNARQVTMFCRRIKALDIKRIRVKMGKSYDQNHHALDAVASELGMDCEIRIDPNGVWERDLAFKHLPIIEKYGVDIVEEPMKREDPGFREFAEALRAKDIALMACESAPTLKDVKKIIAEKSYQIINVKLCRSGGFRRALRMIDTIRKSPLSFQIGCTLGESGILSAAGRALCLLSKDAVNCDGSYDRFLLGKNTTLEDVSFGQKGKADYLKGFGLGVRMNRRNLQDLAVSPNLTVDRH